MRVSTVKQFSIAAALLLSLAACTSGGTNQASESASANTHPTPTMSGQASDAEEKPASEGKSDDTKTASTSGKKDIENWALPQDEFQQIDILLQQKGEQVAIKKCVTEKGVQLEIPPVNYTPEASKQLQQEMKLFGQFKPELAEKRGYRPPIANDANRDYQNFLVTAAKNADPNVLMAMGECMGTIHTTYPFLNPLNALAGNQTGDQAGQHNPMDSLLGEVENQMKVMEEPQVKETVDKWKACLAPTGITDLPANPVQMPPPSKLNAWFAVNTNGNPFTAEPGDEEKTIAKQDAECRQSSGFNEAFYDAVYAFYEKDIDENRAKYEQRQEGIKKNEAETKTFIEQNGG